MCVNTALSSSSSSFITQSALFSKEEELSLSFLIRLSISLFIRLLRFCLPAVHTAHLYKCYSLKDIPELMIITRIFFIIIVMIFQLHHILVMVKTKL